MKKGPSGPLDEKRQQPGLNNFDFGTHGLALFHVFSYVCGLGVPRPDASVFVLVDNASITHVQHRAGDRWRIRTINDTAHLRGL